MHKELKIINSQIENADVSDIADFFGYQKSEIFKHPRFRYSPIVNIENLDFKNQRFSSIRLFDIHL